MGRDPIAPAAGPTQPQAVGASSENALELAGGAPMVTSQIRTTLSAPAEASHRPSGEQPTDHTAPVWPISSCRCMPVAGSQIRIIRSSPAEPSRRPSGANRSDRTRAGVPGQLAKPCPGGPVPKSAPPGGRRRTPRTRLSSEKPADHTGPVWPVHSRISAPWAGSQIPPGRRRTATALPLGAGLPLDLENRLDIRRLGRCRAVRSSLTGHRRRYDAGRQHRMQDRHG